jgi:hypothetical protein
MAEELQKIVGGADKLPLAGHALETPQPKSTEASRFFDLP